MGNEFTLGPSYLTADAFFKAAISLVPEVPKSINVEGKTRPSEPFLLEFLFNFFSTLLIVPVGLGLQGCWDPSQCIGCPLTSLPCSCALALCPRCWLELGWGGQCKDAPTGVQLTHLQHCPS